ncbi:MAG: S1C family serine protease, partial [Pseudomonadota bacterium]|nr:S1C family serine protease [Pseudomonadota bacterium]
MAKSDLSIPTAQQPKPADYRFDLEGALRAVVGLRALVPEDAFTAGTLGTERAGSAVHIQPGLFLTIGYLITEAETLWLTTYDGSAIAGHALAYDQETGFGLVQALGQAHIPTIPLGDSTRARPGDTVVFAAAGGRKHCVAAKIAGRQEFAGYWEYLLDDAIFTLPAHPFWGGGALLSDEGALIGIGSLVLQQGGEGIKRQDMNMVVPIELLLPIMDDLKNFGQVNRPARPWLGLYAMEDDEALVVGGLADNGPADKAGLRTGDRILAINGTEVPDLAGLWR